jgi:hypothetical protein
MAIQVSSRALRSPIQAAAIISAIAATERMISGRVRRSDAVMIEPSPQRRLGPQRANGAGGFHPLGCQPSLA